MTRMRATTRNILFLATEYDAPGMRPYARNIINALWQKGDHLLIVTRHGADSNAFPNIPADCITWIDYPSSKISRAIFRYHPAIVNRAINHIIAHHDIGLVYSLTGELILAPTIKRLGARVPVLYTVHDAVYHDYKFSSPVQWLKDRMIIAWPQQHLFKHTPFKVTNSLEQLDSIAKRFPGHQVHYAPFPTLVNDDIARGDRQVEELMSVNEGYILFFGTLHLYKGVHLLYDAYLSHPELQDRQLVIAGTKDIYFQRCKDENGVIFINRFIEDCELKDLFSRAAVVVYPYISATQSGVTSIASYFGKPMVLSNLPYFTQTCHDTEGVFFFTNGDSEALATAISQAIASSASTSSLYSRIYSLEALRSSLEDLISQVATN